MKDQGCARADPYGSKPVSNRRRRSPIPTFLFLFYMLTKYFGNREKISSFVFQVWLLKFLFPWYLSILKIINFNLMLSTIIMFKSLPHNWPNHNSPNHNWPKINWPNSQLAEITTARIHNWPNSQLAEFTTDRKLAENFELLNYKVKIIQQYN